MGHTHYYEFKDIEGSENIIKDDFLWNTFLEEVKTKIVSSFVEHDLPPSILVLDKDRFQINFPDPIGYEDLLIERKLGFQCCKTYFLPREDDAHELYDMIVFTILSAFIFVYGSWVKVRSDKTKQTHLYQKLARSVDKYSEKTPYN